ncbi:MAG: AMP-binding protein [bacterium]|nr:AMP-binding protein [bacterium]
MSSSVSEPSENQNLFSEIERRSRDYSESIAFKADGGRGKAYTYHEATQIISQLSSGLQAGSLVAKREIGLVSENRPEWCLAYLAIVAAGGTVVPIDANLKLNEIAYVVDHAELDVVFCSARFEQPLSGLGRTLRTISLEPDAENSFRNLLDEQEKYRICTDNDIAVLIYTSGTTGDPKAVELTHRNLLSNVEGIERGLCFDSNDRFLSILPLHHTFEATCGFLTPMMRGAQIISARSFKSKDIFEDIGHNKITVMCGVPLLYEKAYQSIRRALNSAPAGKRLLFNFLYSLSRLGWKLQQNWGKPFFGSLRAKGGLSSIRMFVSGGAALPPKICAFFNLIGIGMIQGYGMTETAPVVAANRPADIRFSSVGRPLDNVSVKIDQPDSSGVGEIIVRGENITPGYRGNSEKTAELIKDGWLHTGDLGKLKRGHLYITGRAKNLIVSAAGKNIYPEEIEEKLLESDLVMEAVVFGRTKEGKQGEEVRAVLVPDMDELAARGTALADSVDMSEVRAAMEEVVRSVNDSIADYKRISAFNVQLEELEKTTKKSVKRFAYK